MSKYVIELKPYGDYLEFLCPLTGPRLTKDIDKAEVYPSWTYAEQIATALNEKIISDAVATLVEIEPRKVKARPVGDQGISTPKG